VRALQGIVLGAALLAAAGCTRAAPVETGTPLRALAKAGTHPDLRWPKFPEFRSEVQRLYERAGWQPLWLDGGRPTEAARRLIARLAAADSVGLDPVDYDAGWLERRARELASPGSARLPGSISGSRLPPFGSSPRFTAGA
jgi:murein L,D-transpeptidase YcbB/YkuD